MHGTHGLPREDQQGYNKQGNICIKEWLHLVTENAQMWVERVRKGRE